MKSKLVKTFQNDDTFIYGAMFKITPKYWGNKHGQQNVNTETF